MFCFFFSLFIITRYTLFPPFVISVSELRNWHQKRKCAADMMSLYYFCVHIWSVRLLRIFSQVKSVLFICFPRILIFRFGFFYLIRMQKYYTICIAIIITSGTPNKMKMSNFSICRFFFFL